MPGTAYVHSVTATSANVHNLDQITNLVCDDNEIVYTDAGYQGVEKRREDHLSGRVPDRGAQESTRGHGLTGP